MLGPRIYELTMEKGASYEMSTSVLTLINGVVILSLLVSFALMYLLSIFEMACVLANVSGLSLNKPF
jgi:hypothetical protein